MKKITEQPSRYRHLEKMSTRELLQSINSEDITVPQAVGAVIPQIEKVVDEIVPLIEGGGRLFYIGAGTSGRLGILDASECPPTFGVPHEMVIGLIAGGDDAIRKAVEKAEDDTAQCWQDLQEFHISSQDFLIGIAASGTTPYVIGGIKDARDHGIKTSCITCNIDSPLEKAAEFPIAAPVGPEFITGSTRMKAGTAQKLILNMISTSVMIKLGRVEDNKMVDMQLSNAKLHKRAEQMLMDDLGIDLQKAQELLAKCGSVRAAKEFYSGGG